MRYFIARMSGNCASFFHLVRGEEHGSWSRKVVPRNTIVGWRNNSRHGSATFCQFLRMLYFYLSANGACRTLGEGSLHFACSQIICQQTIAHAFLFIFFATFGRNVHKYFGFCIVGNLGFSFINLVCFVWLLGGLGNSIRMSLLFRN